VDGPLAASRCQNADWSETTDEQGAIHERDYDDRVRLGEACFPGTRGDAAGATVLRKQLRRAQVLAFFSRLPRCLVGKAAYRRDELIARRASVGGVPQPARPFVAQKVGFTPQGKYSGKLQ
jgi:hypothetical protein